MWELTLNHYLAVSATLFALGIFGIFLNRKNVITNFDVNRIDAVGGQYQHGRILGL